MAEDPGRVPVDPDAPAQPEQHDPPQQPDRRQALRGAALVAGGALAGAIGGRASARGQELVKDDPSGLAPPASSQAWTFVEPGGSIQDAIDTGAKAIQLGIGNYEVAEPISVTRGCAIRGVGPETTIAVGPNATDPLPSVFDIGGGGQADGVSISSLFISCRDQAVTGIDVHIEGSDGNQFGEPDSVCRFDDLRIWSAIENGIWYHGPDAQAIVTSRVRVRRAGRYGFRIEAPDNVWIACEATTRPGPPAGDRPAGFFVASANNHFSHCKAWYVRGYGWHLAGVRNVLTGCEAQDCADHGFFVDRGKNTLTGCMADTCSAAVTDGTPDGADGFFVRPDTADVVMVGCLAFDRTASPQQRYGFNVPAAMVSEGRFAGNAAWDNLTGGVNGR